MKTNASSEITKAFSSTDEYSVERVYDSTTGKKRTKYRGIISERRECETKAKPEGSIAEQVRMIEDSTRNGFRYPIENESKTIIRRWSQYGETKIMSFDEAVKELAPYGYTHETAKQILEECFYIQIPLMNPEPTYCDYDNSLEYDTITYCLERN